VEHDNRDCPEAENEYSPSIYRAVLCEFKHEKRLYYGRGSTNIGTLVGALGDAISTLKEVIKRMEDLKEQEKRNAIRR